MLTLTFPPPTHWEISHSILQPDEPPQPIQNSSVCPSRPARDEGTGEQCSLFRKMRRRADNPPHGVVEIWNRPKVANCACEVSGNSDTTRSVSGFPKSSGFAEGV